MKKKEKEQSKRGDRDKGVRKLFQDKIRRSKRED